MSNEEILSEIGKAMSMMGDTKSIVNEALCHAQNIVKKYNEQTVSEDTLEMERMKVLNEGRNEVWELAKKISVEPDNGGFSRLELGDIFGIDDLDKIFINFTPQEALAKLEAYEKEQNEIKVGDVIICYDKEGVVTKVNDNFFNIVYKDGSSDKISQIICKKKTGKHIDIQSILQQIGE